MYGPRVLKTLENEGQKPRKSCLRPGHKTKKKKRVCEDLTEGGTREREKVVV